ncbi:MAG: ankyrin repeat domain-containing protein [Wolbachia endosymbiont of Fragariocoptes setiger]|nr:ankyrin repeat domain-containing protein [Wolbachia endosymbiont of Fragariocoptes setiger]
MPVKYVTNEISLSTISYKKLQKVAENIEDALKAQKDGKPKNEYSKLNNSDSVVEICKKYFKKFHKDTYQLWEKSNFEKNYCINFKDNTKNSTINSSSFTLLQMFSHFKCVEAVRALLQEDANVNEPNKSGRVALHDAVIIQSKKKKEDKDQINASIEITKLLLAKNADIYIEYEYRKNALTYAIECENSRVAELLTEKYIATDTIKKRIQYLT